jgi:hypothetical protein
MNNLPGYREVLCIVADLVFLYENLNSSHPFYIFTLSLQISPPHRTLFICHCNTLEGSLHVEQSHASTNKEV